MKIKVESETIKQRQIIKQTSKTKKEKKKKCKLTIKRKKQ